MFFTSDRKAEMFGFGLALLGIGMVHVYIGFKASRVDLGAIFVAVLCLFGGGVFLQLSFQELISAIENS